MQKDKGLLRRYAAGERNFSGEDFSGITLYGSSRQKINLSDADFSQANLSNTHITGRIDNIKFIGANFTDARINVYALNNSIGIAVLNHSD